MEGKPLRLTPHEYCIRSGQIALLDEWDKMGNHSLKPGGAFFKSGSGLMEVRCRPWLENHCISGGCGGEWSIRLLKWANRIETISKENEYGAAKAEE